MTERDMAHGQDWQGEDLAGWYLTEKLDGCRGYWDGKRFWTRSGNIIDAPAAIFAAMPAEPVDGEFWAGRGGFSRASAAVRIGGNHWEGVEFKPFDYPERPGDWMARNNRGTVCLSNRHAVALMAEIVGSGGEGLIARKPGVAYKAGRSNDILKIKQGR